MDSRVFDRARSSLIVIDMINDALKPEGTYLRNLGMRYVDEEVLFESNQRLIEVARSFSVPVIFTRTARKPAEAKYLEHFIPPVGQRTQTYEVEICVEDTWGDAIIDELKPWPNEHVIAKKRRSAFLYTPLDLILRSMNITTLVVAGIGTPGCVESTVRAAFDLDYYIIIPKECTSSTHGREEIDRSLQHMGRHCAIITTVDRAIAAISSPDPAPLLSLQIPGF